VTDHTIAVLLAATLTVFTAMIATWTTLAR
jgi:hypothetical protein